MGVNFVCNIRALTSVKLACIPWECNTCTKIMKLTVNSWKLVLHLSCWFLLLQLAKIIIYLSIAAWFLYRATTESGGMNSGPYRKHVRWGQYTRFRSGPNKKTMILAHNSWQACLVCKESDWDTNRLFALCYNIFPFLSLFLPLFNSPPFIPLFSFPAIPPLPASPSTFCLLFLLPSFHHFIFSFPSLLSSSCQLVTISVMISVTTASATTSTCVLAVMPAVTSGTFESHVASPG